MFKVFIGKFSEFSFLFLMYFTDSGKFIDKFSDKFTGIKFHN